MDLASSAELTLRDLEDQLPHLPQRPEWVRRWAPELGTALVRTIGEPEPPEGPAGEDEMLEEEDLLDQMGAAVDKMLSSLGPRLELVLRMRLGIGKLAVLPAKEVAKSFAVSRNRIYQLQAEALRRLCEIHPVEVRDFQRQLRQLQET